MKCLQTKNSRVFLQRKLYVSFQTQCKSISKCPTFIFTEVYNILSISEYLSFPKRICSSFNKPHSFSSFSSSVSFPQNNVWLRIPHHRISQNSHKYSLSPCSERLMSVEYKLQCFCRDEGLHVNARPLMFLPPFTLQIVQVSCSTSTRGL